MTHSLQSEAGLTRLLKKASALAFASAALTQSLSAQSSRTSGVQAPSAARTDRSELETAILKALSQHPATAPYTFQTTRSASRIVLRGVVGSKEIYDIAVRLAMSVTPLFDDRLVIDTSSIVPPVSIRQPVNLADVADQSLRAMVGLNPPLYPPPLFGRYDDPFWGFEQPLITYPPWWSSQDASRADLVGRAEEEIAAPRSELPNDAVEMTVDPRGVAVLRGTVATQRDKIAIAEKAATLDGVTDVVNLLRVGGSIALSPPQRLRRDVPPPPPEPDPPAGPDPVPPVPQPAAPMSGKTPNESEADHSSISQRVNAALERRPILKGTPIQVEVRQGVATLTGEVPSVFEAMTAYRAVQQTVGVTSVVDRLRFAVPDDQHPNPLVERGRPQDVEPYLLAQIRRQVGEQAHMDRVEVSGDRARVHGTVTRETDRERITAVLRSMPVLRGFQVQPMLVIE